MTHFGKESHKILANKAQGNRSNTDILFDIGMRQFVARNCGLESTIMCVYIICGEEPLTKQIRENCKTATPTT